MFVVVLLFVAATVIVPTVQALLVSGARDLPLGLSDVKGLVYGVTLAIGVGALFVTLCAIYRLVPKARMPWAAVWPGALGATIAIGIVDLGFPLYLDNISTLRIGTSAVFVLIALVWFYVIALIVLAGAVINGAALRAPEPGPGDRLKTGATQPNTQWLGPGARGGALPRPHVAEGLRPRRGADGELRGLAHAEIRLELPRQPEHRHDGVRDPSSFAWHG